MLGEVLYLPLGTAFARSFQCYDSTDVIADNSAVTEVFLPSKYLFLYCVLIAGGPSCLLLKTLH